MVGRTEPYYPKANSATEDYEPVSKVRLPSCIFQFLVFSRGGCTAVRRSVQLTSRLNPHNHSLEGAHPDLDIWKQGQGRCEVGVLSSEIVSMPHC